MIYDFTPAYLKPPLQIRVPHLHKAMSPNVTGDMVRMVRFAKKTQFNNNKCCSYPKMCINISINKKTMLQKKFIFFFFVD